MFTGLVENTGRITGRKLTGESGKLMVVPDRPFSGLQKGESIAVNGACLTLEEGMNGGPLVFHVLRETLERTNLGVVDRVNLERAMVSGGRFGGHIVQGHVDGTGTVLSLQKRSSDWELTVGFPEEMRPFLVEKGSIALDGVSLTLEKVFPDSFRIGLIPTTLHDTVLSSRKNGDRINLETDILGKYVVGFLTRTGKGGEGVSMDLLARAGFL